jgi:hypothetical protein
MAEPKTLEEENNILKKQNMDLLNEIDMLRERLLALEELVIESKVEYNEDTFWPQEGRRGEH